MSDDFLSRHAVLVTSWHLNSTIVESCAYVSDRQKLPTSCGCESPLVAAAFMTFYFAANGFRNDA
jgi:hypothetical protein